MTVYVHLCLIRPCLLQPVLGRTSACEHTLDVRFQHRTTIYILLIKIAFACFE
jgi:hypothetical protein